MKLGSILHLSRNMAGKGGLSSSCTVWTHFDFGLILRDLQTYLRQVMHLSCHRLLSANLLPGVSTAAQSRQRQDHHFINVFAHL